jgi:hypothetical protein
MTMPINPLNRMGGRPRPVQNPEGFIGWQLPKERGICNAKIYRYFVVGLAHALGMQVEDAHGNRIPRGNSHELDYEVSEVDGKKRVKFSFTLTE